MKIPEQTKNRAPGTGGIIGTPMILFFKLKKECDG